MHARRIAKLKVVNWRKHRPPRNQGLCHANWRTKAIIDDAEDSIGLLAVLLACNLHWKLAPPTFELASGGRRATTRGRRTVRSRTYPSPAQLT